MKYKEGDKVRIRSKEWYDKHKDAHGEIRGAFFDKDRVKLCGTIQTIANKGFIDGLGMTIYAVEDAYEFIGEEAIEGLVEEETSIKGAPIWPIHWHNVDLSNEFECPDGYEFHDENGNVIEAKKIVLEKKKPRCPKSYSESCAIIGAQISRSIFYTKKDKDDYPNEVKILSQLDDLRMLLICRDAYWKIAGEEKGLGKPWEPDWKESNGGYRYCIYNEGNSIILGKEWLGRNVFLAFPTAEMRDAFYENFKDLINKCKELL